jgi:hypothetical protein
MFVAYEEAKIEDTKGVTKNRKSKKERRNVLK